MLCLPPDSITQPPFRNLRSSSVLFIASPHEDIVMRIVRIVNIPSSECYKIDTPQPGFIRGYYDEGFKFDIGVCDLVEWT